MSAIDDVIAKAYWMLGTPYVLGAESETAVDCSGLVFRCFMDTGHGDLINYTRRLAAGYANYFSNRNEYSNDINDAQRGDLICYTHGSPHISHIAIYIGGGRIISALTTTGVTETRYNSINVTFNGVCLVPYEFARTGGGSTSGNDNDPESGADPTDPDYNNQWQQNAADIAANVGILDMSAAEWLLPVRKQVITFPTPTDARFEYLLSLDYDQGLTIIDPYPGPPDPPGVTPIPPPVRGCAPSSIITFAGGVPDPPTYYRAFTTTDQTIWNQGQPGPGPWFFSSDPRLAGTWGDDIGDPNLGWLVVHYPGASAPLGNYNIPVTSSHTTNNFGSTVPAETGLVEWMYTGGGQCSNGFQYVNLAFYSSQSVHSETYPFNPTLQINFYYDYAELFFKLPGDLVDAVLIPGVFPSPDVWYKTRFRRTATALQLRIWASSDTEPTTWNVDYPWTNPEVVPQVDAIWVDSVRQAVNVSGNPFLDVAPAWPELAFYIRQIGAYDCDPDQQQNWLEYLGNGLYQMPWGYAPGSLAISNNGITLRSGVDFTETDPGAGQFTLSDTTADFSTDLTYTAQALAGFAAP